MKQLFWLLALLFGATGAPQVLAQPASVKWPLTIGTGWTSSAPSLVTGNPQVILGGPQIQVFDYWSGQAQRLWAGTSGWAAAPASPGRYLQFDALPTPGNQLSVTSVSFNHGGAGIAGHVRSEVRYSVDNWTTSTVLAPAVAYPHPAMVPFSMTITPAPPAVASGGKFSLRIYPYTILDSIAGSPTFASHNSVVINGTSAPGGGGGGAKARFDIRKSTGSTMVAGTYTFTVTCTGSGGPYTGTNPVTVTLPTPGVTSVSVPSGSICGIVEALPVFGSWSPPAFSGNGLAVAAGAPWSAKFGPVTGSGGTVTVTNRPGKDDPKLVRFDIRKAISGPMVPGSYNFTLTCNGPGGPYTGPNPVSVTLPIPAVSSVTVPSGSVCSIVEAQPATGTWAPPTFAGTGLALQAGAPWNAKAGPITGPGGTVLVTNNPAPVGNASCPAYIFTANLNVGAMISSTTGGNLNHQTNNGTVEKYCYGDSPGSCTTYGGLYEWDEAMGYATGNNNDLTGARVQGICPAGFHIPSDLEWARYAWCQESSVAPTGPTPLSTFQNQSNFGWMGSTAPGVGPGDKMKIAFGSFTPPWTGTNASGFGALPAGHRTMSVGTFANAGDFTAYWTATPGNTSAMARYFVLDSPSSTGRSGRNMALNGYGMSVRCMKDY